MGCPSTERVKMELSSHLIQLALAGPRTMWCSDFNNANTGACGDLRAVLPCFPILAISATPKLTKIVAIAVEESKGATDQD